MSIVNVQLCQTIGTVESGTNERSKKKQKVDGKERNTYKLKIVIRRMMQKKRQDSDSLHRKKPRAKSDLNYCENDVKSR